MGGNAEVIGAMGEGKGDRDTAFKALIKAFQPWPLLLGAMGAIVASIILYRQTGDPNDGRVAAGVLLVLGAVLLGAFMHDNLLNADRDRVDPPATEKTDDKKADDDSDN